MFDMGFSEILLIMVILLIVVGPERLPGLARSAGRWVGKARRMVASVKADMEEELRVDELKRSIQEEGALDEFKKLSDDMKDLGSEVSNLRSDLDKKITSDDANPTTNAESVADVAETVSTAATIPSFSINNGDKENLPHSSKDTDDSLADESKLATAKNEEPK